MNYRTKDGDTLDLICWRHYGQQSGAVEQVLEANPKLAEKGSILSAGIIITLPELTSPAVEEEISLWD